MQKQNRKGAREQGSNLTQMDRIPNHSQSHGRPKPVREKVSISMMKDWEATKEKSGAIGTPVGSFWSDLS